MSFRKGSRVEIGPPGRSRFGRVLQVNGERIQVTLDSGARIWTPADTIIESDHEGLLPPPKRIQRRHRCWLGWGLGSSALVLAALYSLSSDSSSSATSAIPQPSSVMAKQPEVLPLGSRIHLTPANVVVGETTIRLSGAGIDNAIAQESLSQALKSAGTTSHVLNLEPETPHWVLQTLLRSGAEAGQLHFSLPTPQGPVRLLAESGLSGFTRQEKEEPVVRVSSAPDAGFLIVTRPTKKSFDKKSKLKSLQFFRDTVDLDAPNSLSRALEKNCRDLPCSRVLLNLGARVPSSTLLDFAEGYRDYRSRPGSQAEIIIRLGSPSGLPKAKPVTGVRIGEITVREGLGSREVRAVVQGQLKHFERCYEVALEHTPGLAGVVVVHFGIDSGGNVSRVESSKSELGGGAVGQGIAARFYGLKFSPPTRNGVSASIAIELRTGSSLDRYEVDR